MTRTFQPRFIPFMSLNEPKQVFVTTVTDTFADGVFDNQIREAQPIHDPIALVLALREAANELERLV